MNKQAFYQGLIDSCLNNGLNSSQIQNICKIAEEDLTPYYIAAGLAGAGGLGAGLTSAALKRYAIKEGKNTDNIPDNIVTGTLGGAGLGLGAHWGKKYFDSPVMGGRAGLLSGAALGSGIDLLRAAP